MAEKLDVVVAASQDAPVQVANPDDPGMGHGRFGWIADDPDKFYSVAAERNKAVIGEILVRYLSSHEQGSVLEIGSGSGQHISLFANMLPNLNFQPTEYNGHPNPAAEPQEAEKILTSIRKTVASAQVTNVLDAQYLDASSLDTWAGAADNSLRAIVAINVVHISPETVLAGIVKGASKKLVPGGLLFFYGAWGVDGVISPESNLKFDAMLREKNASFGIRDITSLAALCDQEGNLKIEERIFVESSNNYMLCIRKSTQQEEEEEEEEFCVGGATIRGSIPCNKHHFGM